MSSPALITQTDAKRLFKAARDAGFVRAKLTKYPDGRIEIIGENGSEEIVDTSLSPFEQWKSSNESRS